MSPSRKVGVIGMSAGAVLAVAGLALFVLPLFYAKPEVSPSLGFTVRRTVLSDSAESWLIGAPTGLVLLSFGAVVLILSLVIYFDAKRKEAAKI